MFRWLVSLTGYLAPMFIVASPMLSYSDQAYSMWRRKSSAGFSLDIPLIMLVASMCKIFYWPGARFDTNLLIQAILMIVIQTVILKISLDHRPPPSSAPFAAAEAAAAPRRRPFDFWRWRSPVPYWEFLLCVFIGLTGLELLLAPLPPVYAVYSSTVGYVGLAIEAILPVPQILTNGRARSCRGFRPSVLVNWLVGDGMKMVWFFTAAAAIPWSFKLCAIFQTGCDLYLGYQFLRYGAGPADGPGESRKDGYPMMAQHHHRGGGGAYPRAGGGGGV